MDMEQQKEKNTTSIALKNRSSLNIDGVSDIISSDESSVYLDTSDGALLIEGSELRIISMNVVSHEMSIDGRIDTIAYHDKTQTQKSGFFARMFK
jgi:sporulation protein YabP